MPCVTVLANFAIFPGDIRIISKLVQQQRREESLQHLDNFAELERFQLRAFEVMLQTLTHDLDSAPDSSTIS